MILFTLILFAFVVYVIFTFNRFVSLNNRVREAWSGIDVHLKMRHDLIPNLVETVKSYGDYEQQTLEQVVSLRSRSQSVGEQGEKQEIEQGISQDLKKIIALAEAYPDLKADKNFRELQETLTKIEEKLQYARRYYNGSVRDLNILVQSVPSNVIAQVFKFTSKEFFEIDFATEKAVPEINL